MSWNNYKQRLVPWIAFNWSKSKIVKAQSVVTKEAAEGAKNSLLSFIDKLSKTNPLLTPRDTQRLTSAQLRTIYSTNSTLFLKEYGFNTTIGNSLIKGGGRGVFITTGTVRKGQLVALYPGTVYFPGDPILIQSLCNLYILRCIDGIHIDGKNTGLSRLIYRSCAFRDLIGRWMSCDLTWPSLTPINPLAIGQIINNAPDSSASNVQYIEMDMLSPEPKLCQYLPNIHFQPHLHSKDNSSIIRTVGLLATRDISTNEELYSSYFTVVDDS